MKQVSITALRPFNRTPQGDICEPGDVFEVSESRADELERLKLAMRTSGETQAAPKPLNKAAPKPKAKG